MVSFLDCLQGCTGNQAENETGNLAGNETGISSGNETGNRSGSEAGNRPENETGNQARNETGDRSGPNETATVFSYQKQGVDTYMERTGNDGAEY